MIKFLKWPKMCQHLTAGTQAERRVVSGLRTCGFSGSHLLLGMPELAVLRHMAGNTDSGVGLPHHCILVFAAFRDRMVVISETGRHLLEIKKKKAATFLVLRVKCVLIWKTWI